ncbi:hypothetical protein [Modicisalibacter coralii]|nr:hypothetical protein [Halomonas coralii]
MRQSLAREFSNLIERGRDRQLHRPYHEKAPQLMLRRSIDSEVRMTSGQL